ncbi:uncharacterized protein N7469_002069 [Penicillium citrinum]|uniref:DUF7223 domain-containing protein n=1 Tax=Penicillium citrinum TaxID=5077 RepID=A0A9W9PC16_PENCI|nr:uncharacterized protein N7469_002069 [Penicillium citrinum]KAJ5240478.1 hypothetical protein N7469_002069 [Penicillium citrinum]
MRRDLHSQVLRSRAHIQTDFDANPFGAAKEATEKARSSLLSQASGVISQIVTHGVELFYEKFTKRYDYFYQYDYELHDFLQAGPSDKGPLVLGERGYLVAEYHGPRQRKKDTSLMISCLKCGIEGKFTVEGRFSFHLTHGLTAGSFVVDSASDIKVYTHIGIAANGEFGILEDKRQLHANRLSPVTVPGLFILGPEVTFASALNLDISGKDEFIIGGTVTISKGRVNLDLMNKGNSEIVHGFKSSFEPRAKNKGHIELTAAVGIPIGLELGLNVLDGKFKSTVGLIDTPSLYISAKASVNEASTCQGVDVAMGIRDKMEINTSNHYSLKVKNPPLYDKNLGCTSAAGFDRTTGKPASSIFQDIERHFGGASRINLNTQTQVRDLASKLSGKDQPKWWSIIMNKNETSYLVTGTDGHLYLAEQGEKNEVSEPWGTVEPQSGLYAFDAMGRFLGFDPDEYENTKHVIVTPRVYDGESMPDGNLFA